MAKYIKKKALKNAIDCCTWYHINKNGELVEGANSSEHEPLYKYSDIKEIIKNLPTRKFETEPKRTALSKALKWTYGDEPSDSEKPNNCEHITEDGVTCAKYPACDDCLDNPLNKLKGSERLVKGSEQTKPTISKMEQVDKDINVRSKDEPKTDMAEDIVRSYGFKAESYQQAKAKDEPQTDCSWK